MTSPALQQWYELGKCLDLGFYHPIITTGTVSAQAISRPSDKETIAAVFRTESGTRCLFVIRWDGARIFKIDDETLSDEWFTALAVSDQDIVSSPHVEMAFWIPTLLGDSISLSVAANIGPRSVIDNARRRLIAAARPAHILTRTGMAPEDYITLIESALILSQVATPHLFKRNIRVFIEGIASSATCTLIDHINTWHQPKGSKPVVTSGNRISGRDDIFISGPDLDQMSAHDILSAIDQAKPKIDAFYLEAQAHPQISTQEHEVRRQLKI